MLNHVEIMGRLTRDPEMRKTQTGVPVVGFGIACDRNFKNKDTGERDVDFFDVTAWRGTAEFASKYLSKGRMVVIEGVLQQRKWTDKEGNKRQAVEIKADNIFFADGKRDDAPAHQASGDDQSTEYGGSYEGFEEAPSGEEGEGGEDGDAELNKAINSLPF